MESKALHLHSMDVNENSFFSIVGLKLCIKLLATHEIHSMYLYLRGAV